MSKSKSIPLSLDPEWAEFLEACVASGRFPSARAVVVEALQLLQDQLGQSETSIDRARALIQEGAEQLEQGQVVSGEAFFREWDAELDALEGAQRS